MKKIYLFFHFNLFLSLLNAQNFQWAKNEGLWAYDYGYGIACDNAGNVYLTGKYELEANFSGTILPDQGNHDIYLVQYSPNGTLNWVRTAGGPLGDYATSIACDGSNYVYIAGELEGDYLDITFVGTSTTITSIGKNDIFLAKYDLNGNLVWAKQAGWWLNEKALGITYDTTGNVYICGFFNDTTYFGGNQILGYGLNDIFVAKYDANGNFQWVRKAGGKKRDEAKSIKCDAAGNVYVCGMFKDTATFGSQTVIAPNGYFDMFLAKYSPNGNLVWLKTHGANYDDVAWSLTIDNSGKIYVSGEFNDYVYFDGIPLETIGEADVFVACFNSSGNVIWVNKAGGDWVDRARGIGTDGDNIYITGQFGATATFGSYSITPNDSSDIFVAALNNSGSFTWAASVGGVADSTEDLGYESGNAICADLNGSVYATGALLDNGIFGGTTLSTWDRTDVFITKISQGCSSAPAQPGAISGATAICQGTGNTYSIAPVNSATSYSWALPAGWTGNSTSTSISAMAGAAGGNITVAANNSCGGSAVRSLSVSVNQSPTISNAGTDQNICVSTATLAGNTPTAGTGAWTLISGTATITSSSSPTSGVTGIVIGSNTLRWTISSSGCASTADDVIITRTQNPTTADAGINQNICSSTATLAANTPMVGTGTWSVISGTATITSSSSPTSGLTGIGVGTNTLRWAISSSGCTSTTDDVIITRAQNPTTANAGSDQSICSPTATLSANTPTAGTGIWSVISGTATITSPSSPTSGLTGIDVGANTLRWTISSSGCASSEDDIIITRSQNISTANAGPDQDICSSTATLSGNTPTEGTGIWSVISGTATITSPYSPVSEITGIGIGTNTLRWTISGSGCTSTTDDVIITRAQNPTMANAGSDQSICSPTSTLSGNTPTSGTGIWSVISGTATITSPSSPTSGVTGIDVGANTLRWTISGSGCTSSTDDVIITRSQNISTANAGPDQDICSSTATLSGNTPTEGTGIWSVISGTATITSPSSPTSGVTGIGIGTNTLRWTISGSGCTASTDDVVITRLQGPTTANAGPDQNICSSTSTLSGNTPTEGTGIWSVISGTATITSPSSPTSGVTGIDVGENTLRWTISGSGCTSSTDDVIITRSQNISTANAGPDQDICSSTATLSGNTPTEGTGIWSVISGTATITSPSSPTSELTGIGVGANTLRWTISSSGCTSTTDDVIITRAQNPTTANAGSDQSICSPTSTLSGNTPTEGTGIWSVISGTATITSSSSPTSGVTGIDVGVNTLRWTISSSGCVPSTDDVIITRSQNISTANAGPDQEICSSTATLSGNTPTEGTGIWSVISGTATITSSSSPTSGLTGIGFGSNTLRWTISSSGCDSSTDDVIITRAQNPTVANAGTDQNICSPTSTLSANTPTDGTGSWSVVSGTATITFPSSPTSGLTGIGVGSNTLRWTISSGSCTSSTDDVVITRSQNPSTANAGPDQNTCESSATLEGISPTVGTGLWSVISGTAIITTPSSPISEVSGIAVGTNTLRWTVGNGDCDSSSDDVIIERFQNPTVIIFSEKDTICNGSSTSIHVNGASAYLWMPGGMTNDTINVNPVASTTYSVTGTDNNGCTGTASFTLIVSECVGINESANEEEVLIFPNPGKHDFKITGVLFPVEVIFYSSLGKLVFIQKVENENLILDLSSGIYFIEINNNKRTVRKKIVVE